MVIKWSNLTCSDYTKPNSWGKLRSLVRIYFCGVTYPHQLYQNTKWLCHFVFLKPLVGLVFNSQKCHDTFVKSYYLTSVRVNFKLSPREGSRREPSLEAKTVKVSLLLFWLLKFCSLSRTHITYIAAVDCVRTKAKPKKRMAARSAAILFLGFMSSYIWRQLYI